MKHRYRYGNVKDRWQWSFLTKQFNIILDNEKMPEERKKGLLVLTCKNKGDVQSCGIYREIKLMSQSKKIWERAAEAKLM